MPPYLYFNIDFANMLEHQYANTCPYFCRIITIDSCG